jgi:hypothetical protein
MRLSRLSFVLAAAAWLAFASAARAELVISIDKSAQQMTVIEDGVPLYTWPVSTGRRGHDTPDGTFKPFRMEREHFSQEWDDAPMPHSIFFTQLGHAIHGTYEVKNLGRPVSHGCVRLSRANATILFDLVKQEHMANTRVVLSGEIPGGGGAPVARRNSQPRTAGEDDVADDDAVTGAPPPPRYGAPSRGWRVYRDDDRTVYERQYAPRRYYAAPPPPSFPFGW